MLSGRSEIEKPAPIARAEAAYCGDRPPSLEECRQTVRECVEAAARWFLEEQGIPFRRAATVGDATKILDADMNRNEVAQILAKIRARGSRAF